MPHSIETVLTENLKQSVIQLKGALALLQERLEQDVITHETCPTWLWEYRKAFPGVTGDQRLDKQLSGMSDALAPTRLRQRLEGCQFISAIDYTDGQSPQGTWICPGLFGATEPTLDAGRAVNQAKTEVAGALKALDNRVGRRKDVDGQVRDTLIREAMNQTLNGRLHRRQATRPLLILEEPVRRATFFWAKVRKIQRLTRAEAIARINEMIEKKKNDDTNKAQNTCALLRSDLERVAALPDEERLAWVKSPHPSPKVNLVLESTGVLAPRRVVLPVLYPWHPAMAAPEVRPLPENYDSQPVRLSRSDREIETKPYTQAASFYRYLPGFRSLAPKGQRLT